MGGFGKFIKKVRKEKSLTLVELSSLTKISNPYLSQIENDKFEPSLEVLSKLSTGLNLPLSTLIESAGYPLNKNEEEEKDIKLIYHFLNKIETKLEVYSDQIEELKNKKHELFRQHNGLIKDLYEKQGESK